MLVIAAGSVALLAVIVFVVGIVGSQRGEKAIYYAARREAHRTASRLYSWSLWCLGLAAALFVASWVLPRENLPLTPATNPDVPTAMSAASAIALPTTSATETAMPPTQPPSATPVLATPTLPAIVTLPVASTPEPRTPVLGTPVLGTPAVLANIPPSVTAPANAAQPIVITVLASDKPLTLRTISTNLAGTQPLTNSTTEFGNGTATIYVIFDYHNIPRGTILGQVWLRNGASVSASTAKFTKPGVGTDSISWTPKNGFTPGLYEVRVTLANTSQFTANFLVK